MSSTLRRRTSPRRMRSSEGGGAGAARRLGQKRMTSAYHARETLDGASHGRDATLDVDHAQHRLERGREDRLARAAARLVLAAAEAHQRAELELRRPAREVHA